MKIKRPKLFATSILTHRVGAYLVFKNKPELLKIFWNYKQPDDADGLHIGTSYIPDSLNDGILLVFNRYLHDYQFDFWEQHHGSEGYYLQYINLVFSRLLDNFSRNTETNEVTFDNLAIPSSWGPSKVNSMIHQINNLKKAIPSIYNKTDFLNNIGYRTNDVDTLFNKDLILRAL